MREIIDPLYGVTRNNRKIYKGKCVECEGKVALMGGYATLPDTTYSVKSDTSEEDYDKTRQSDSF